MAIDPMVVPAVLGWSNGETREESVRLYALDAGPSPRWAPDGGRTVERAIVAADGGTREGDRYLIVRLGDRFVTPDSMAAISELILALFDKLREVAPDPALTASEDRHRRGFDCPVCDGTGRTIHNDLPDGSARAQTCLTCEGTGRSTGGGPWTRHGHDIPGITVAGPGRPERYRCGGPGVCTVCSQDAERIRQGAAKPCTVCGGPLEHDEATRTWWHADRQAHDHDAEPGERARGDH